MTSPPTIAELARYFLRLGTTGFGGPIALVGAMRRDLVEERRWFAEDDYARGLALAQLTPGPLAAQVAIYLGWLRGGWLGATWVAAAFVLPSFLMVLVLAQAYLRFGGLPWMQDAFYGIGAAVIAIIARSSVRLARSTLARNGPLWAVFAVNAIVTAWTGREIVSIVLASGLGIVAWRRIGERPVTACVALAPLAPLLTGLHGPAGGDTLARIGLYFAEAGAFVFGSGLAIVPYLHGGVVERFGWLDERQFLDAVAVAMITPGPVVITVAFIGYLVAGLGGACVAAIAVFLPCWLFTVIPARRFGDALARPGVRAFVDGVTAAATGAIAGAVVVLGRRAIVDPGALAIAALALAALSTRRVPEPVLVAVAGIAALALRGLLRSTL